jgi:transposase
MSTSILYHGFGIHGYKYLKTGYQEGVIIFHIEKTKGAQYCTECSSRKVIKKGLVIRKLRTLPIGTKRVFLMIHLHRLFCHCCGALKLEPLLLSFPKKHWTKNLGRYIVKLLRRSTVEDVARHLGMSWDTVKDIHKWALSMKYEKRKIKHLSCLGVDEIAVRKGHSYLTVVVDLDTGQVVWVAEGRKSSSLEPFLRRLKKVNAPIKAIAMDMWPAYFTAVMKYYSYRCIVFDPYHVIASCNKMLDELRRQEAAAASREQKNVYTGTRYLLLKGGEKITNNIEAKEKLENLLSLNQSLNIVYILKEELRRFWQFTTRKKAKSYLMNWLYKAWISGIKPFAKFATTIASHHQDILNYFDHQITTGMVEGINNKIKVLKRQAYGFRDTEYFKLRIYAHHESRYELIG